MAFLLYMDTGAVQALKQCIQNIVLNDTNYEVRDGFIWEAMKLARRLNYPTSVYIDEKEGANWPVFCIVLPTGQVSWHMHNTIIPYDGHSTTEKLTRCKDFVQSWAFN